VADDDDSSPNPKNAILARRAKFVAIAMTAIACGKTPSREADPHPCLSQPFRPSDGGSAEEPRPRACLSQQIVPPDGGSPTDDESSKPKPKLPDGKKP